MGSRNNQEKMDQGRQANKSPTKTRDSHTAASQGTRGGDANQSSTSGNPPSQKIMITGDDILIEYVTRLMKMFSTNKIREEHLGHD